MAWLSRNNLQPTDTFTNDNLNNLANDIQNWGGDVNGGGYTLHNCLIAGILSDPTTTVGDLIVHGPGTPGALTRLPVGANGLALVADSTQLLGVKWGVAAGGIVDPTTTKGDLIVKPASGAPTRLGIGADQDLLIADSSQTLGMRWAKITGFAAPGSDTQVTINKTGQPAGAAKFAYNYNADHVLIGGQADDGSSAVLQVAGVTHTTMRVRTDQFISAKAYANPSSLNIPDAGYGAWGYQGGSVYYYWNGSGFTPADLSKLGTGLVDPTSAVGDLIVRGSSGTTRFPVGTQDGQVLEVDSTQPSGIRWVTPPPSGVSSVFNRTGNVAPVKGDYSAALVTNAADTSQSYSDPSWIATLAWSKIQNAPSFLVNPLITQGDLIIYGGSPLNGPGRFPLGVNGQVLTVDGTQQFGVKWATPSQGVTQITPGPLTGAVNFAAGANVTLSQSGNTITIGVPTMTTSGGMPDPTTTMGDLIVHAQSGTTRLPVGTNGQMLTADSTQTAGVKWATFTIPPAGVISLSPGNLTGAVSLQAGTNITITQAGQNITIGAASIGMTDPTTTQGDLIVHSNVGTTRLAVGSNGQVLLADSTQPAGVRWASSGVSAPGTDQQIVYNKVNALAGDAGHTYDYTNHLLYLNADGGQGAYFNARSFSGAVVGFGGVFTGYGARGTMAAPTAIQSGDSLAFYRAYGWDGAAWQPAAQMYISTSVNWASNNAAGFIAFSTNPGGTVLTERMRITAAGNVGISTISPAYKLDIAGGSVATSQVHVSYDGSDTGGWITAGNAGNPMFSGGSAVISNQWIAKATGSILLSLDPSQGAVFYINSGLTVGNSFTPTERMRITSAGNVGIGTANPGTLLDTGTALAPVKVATYQSGGSAYGIGIASSQLTFGAGIAVSGGVPQMVLTTTGQVGIGTTSPSGGLHVASSPQQWSGINMGASIVVDGTRNNAIALLDYTRGNAFAICNIGTYLGIGSAPALTDSTTAPAFGLAIQRSNLFVGIGTTAPRVPLEVFGTAYVCGGVPKVTVGQSNLVLITTDATAPLRGQFTLYSDPTQANRRLSITCLQADFGWPNVTLCESGGNVGIGTASPGVLLDTGTALAGIKIATYQTGGIAYGIGVASNLLTFGAGISIASGTPQMVLTTTGQLGLGTTAPANQLSVIPPANITSPAVYSSPNLQLGVGEASNSPGFRTMLGYVFDTSIPAWKGVVQAIAGGLTTATYLCLNPTGGKVLVARWGDDGTGAALQVSGGISNNGVLLGTGGGGTPGGSNTAVQFNNNGAFGGNVVTGAANGDLCLAGTGATPNGILFSANGSISTLIQMTASGRLLIGFGAVSPTSSALLQIGSDSASKPGTNTWQIASDIRLKRDVRPYRDGLEVLKQVQPIRYCYNGKANLPETEGIGIDAGAHKDILPDCVSTHKGELDGEEADIFAFNSHALTFMLINAVKELAARLEKLEKGE